MHDGPEIKTYLYSGPLKAACEGFVQEKRAVGCLYNTEAKKLSEFSRFTLAFDFPKDTPVSYTHLTLPTNSLV